MVGAAPNPHAAPADDSGLVLTGRTIRQIVRVTVGGSSVRLRVSNEYGSVPLVITRAHIALSRNRAAIDLATDRPVMFDGRPSVTIPAGARVLTDPILESIPSDTSLAISFFFADSARGTTHHPVARQLNYRSTRGDFTSAADFAPDTVAESWQFLSGVEVRNAAATGVIVTLGNSITAGARSTVNANGRWPDILARRLLASNEPLKAVINAGIGGNRVLSPMRGPGALERFDRDVLMQPGVTHIIVLEGINDITRGFDPDPQHEVSADQLINAHRQLIRRAHERGIVIFGGTLTPVGGMAGLTPERVAKRDALNSWIRKSREYDGVIDFDLAVRDPTDSTRFLPTYDSGDHLHPNDAGYRAMGEAIDLTIFRKRRP